tara:strand:+ start:6434 stop:7564 length:1131 start_codon:yes stop_codon:yes gene_type:complete
MAVIDYAVCRRKTSNATFNLVKKNGEEVVTKNVQVTYRVHALEGDDWATTYPNISIQGSYVDEAMVQLGASAITATYTPSNTLPIVGQTFYVSPDGTQYPWWRCTNVAVTRNSSNGLEFNAVATFVDETGQGAGITPPDEITLIDPVIKYEFERFEVTAWTEDDTVQTGAADSCVLPTGTLYSNPPTKIVPQEVIIFSQYEGGRQTTSPAFTYETIIGTPTSPGRLYSVNSTQWKVYDNGSAAFPNAIEKRHAMIVDIKYEETTVLLSDGVRDPCQRVTYKIAVRRYELESLKDNPSTSAPTETLEPGWDQPRVRADTRYLDANSELQPSASLESWGAQQAYLKTDGSPHETDFQKGVPPYSVLRLQPEINYSFLR